MLLFTKRFITKIRVAEDIFACFSLSDFRKGGRKKPRYMCYRLGHTSMSGWLKVLQAIKIKIHGTHISKHSEVTGMCGKYLLKVREICDIAL